MARRSAVRSGPVYSPRGGDDAGAPGYAPGGYEQPADPWNEPTSSSASGGSARKRSGWGGAGGRWFVWLGRLVLWAFILVVVVNGIRVPFERATSKSSSPSPSVPGSAFPTGAASAYALSFADVYLNYDQATAADRQRQLGDFLANGLDAQLGWNSSGKMVLQSAQVASVQPHDANHAVVTLLVRANGNSYQLAVPVYAKDGAMAISAAPALLPMPPRASLPAPTTPNRDNALESALSERFNGFFKAYASGDPTTLAGYTDHPIAGLGGTVTFVQVAAIVAPQGAPDSRTVTTTVVWQLPPAQNKGSASQLAQTYQLTIVKKDGNWYVRDIQGSTTPSS